MMKLSTVEPVKKKVGLALSGGGFRAALFHVGLLAQLAEFRKLKEIDTISTVSGGSIVGMIYYLHLKKWLESNDRPIQDEDYLGIVQAVENDLLNIVQKGFRTFGFRGLHKLYTMTGDELSEKLDEVFKSILNEKHHLSLNDLKIEPLYGQNKPPKIIVNTTSLNNGELWLFTSEENSQIKEYLNEIAKVEGHHNDESHCLSGFTVGKAVAASAAVPAFIKPVSIKKDSLDIQLVDGGILDNLGTNSLLNEGCNHLIISDGSKYLEAKPKPSNFLINVIVRTQNIFINAIVRSNLNNIDIDQEHIDMRYALPRYTRANKELGEVNHGVDIKVQHYLSNMRTDLDSFSEVEAKSLMLLGYKFGLAEFSDMDFLRNLNRMKLSPDQDWQFKSMKPRFQNPDEDYLKELKVGKYSLFRRFRKRFAKLD